MCEYNWGTMKDLGQKLHLLTASAALDVSSPDEGRARVEPAARGVDWDRYVQRVDLPGRTMRLFKVLQSNACENNCRYCGIRRGRDADRASFAPDELAEAFMRLHRRGRAGGLFLSSALEGSVARTMERMLDTARLLRERHDFRGYVHLKLMPGTEAAAIEQALRLADRVSINLETTGSERLACLSPEKDFDTLERTLRSATALRREQGGSPAGITSQLVVGAAGEADADILGLAARLYRDLSLARVYYSAFCPLPGTPMEAVPAVPPGRERRLYQADQLIHAYGFSPDELVLDGDRNLPLAIDPKAAWARCHPEVFPVEVNRADRSRLLRVPGIGPRGADHIVRARREAPIKSTDELRRLGLSTSRCAPYLLLNGRPATTASTRQLPLWEAGV